MEAYKPLIVWVVILFIVGAFLNIFIAPFVDLSPSLDAYGTETNSSISDTTDFLGSSSSNFVSEQIVLFSYLPNYLTIPFFIIGLMLLLLTILNLVPFVG